MGPEVSEGWRWVWGPGGVGPCWSGQAAGAMLGVGPPWPRGPLSWWENARPEICAAGTLWGWGGLTLPSPGGRRRQATLLAVGGSLPQFPPCVQLSLPWKLCYLLRSLWLVGVLAVRPTLGKGPGIVQCLPGDDWQLPPRLPSPRPSPGPRMGEPDMH